MGWLLLALGAGIGLGVILPKAVQKGEGLIRVLLGVLVAALLFLMGLKIGSDREVLSALPSLGIKSLAMGGLPLICSVLLVWLYTRRRKG